jgi:hypothetical protein
VQITNTLFAEELDNLIAQYKIRIQQQRIHAKELSGIQHSRSTRWQNWSLRCPA